MAICQCRLSLLPDSRFLSLDPQILLATAMRANGGAGPLICPCHLHMTATCAGPACVPHALGLTHSSCVVHVCTFCVIFCGLRFNDILVTVLCMQLVYVLHVHSLRLTLQCHAFI